MKIAFAALVLLLGTAVHAAAPQADWRLAYGSQLLGEIEPCG